MIRFDQKTHQKEKTNIFLIKQECNRIAVVLNKQFDILSLH